MNEAMLPPLPTLYGWADRDEREESFSIFMDLANDYEKQVTEHTEEAFGGFWNLPPRQRLALYVGNEPFAQWVTAPVVDGPQTMQARQQVAMQTMTAMGVVDPALMLPEQMQQVAQIVEQSPEVLATKLSMMQLDSNEVEKMARDMANLIGSYGGSK